MLKIFKYRGTFHSKEKNTMIFLIHHTKKKAFFFLNSMFGTLLIKTKHQPVIYHLLDILKSYIFDKKKKKPTRNNATVSVVMRSMS